MRFKGMRLFLPIFTTLLLGGSCTPPDPPLELVDLTGQTVNPLEEDDGRANVFIFTSVDCPVSTRYAPEVERLRSKYGDQGIAFWLVYPNPSETPDQIRKHLEEYGYGLDALRDGEHRLVDLAGARVTPEAAVFVPAMGLVYRGRIDNRYVDFGKARPRATKHDLEEVLEAVVSGESITPHYTEAIGCYISDMKL